MTLADVSALVLAKLCIARRVENAVASLMRLPHTSRTAAVGNSETANERRVAS